MKPKGGEYTMSLSAGRVQKFPEFQSVIRSGSKDAFFLQAIKGISYSENTPVNPFLSNQALVVIQVNFKAKRLSTLSNDSARPSNQRGRQALNCQIKS
jgi:hypothetical protein